jgi:hypothetical protein
VLHEQALQRRVDRAGGPEDALDARPAASGTNDGEVAGPRVAESLPVDDERDSGREERLADGEPAARAELDDDAIALRWRRGYC